MTHDLDGSAGTRTGLLASRRGASIDISHRAHCSPPMLLVRAWWWQPWQQLVKRRHAEKETGSTHFIFAARTPTESRANWVKMVYDTGAQTTLMSGADATKLGYNLQTRVAYGTPGTVGGVGGGGIPVRNLNMTFYLRMRPNDWRLVSGLASVGETIDFTLLGVTHLASLGSAYQVKFV